MKKYRGIFIWLIGLIFNLVESLYFGRNTKLGFNWLPQSRGELICDYISTAIFIVAFIIFLYDYKNYKSKK